MAFGESTGIGFNNPTEIETNIVIITGGAGEGVFLYNGAPSLGNEPVMSLTGPNTTEDPYGNTVVPDGFTVYNASGAAAIFVGLVTGNLPIIQIGTTGSSLVTLNPNVNTPFNITTAIAGTLQSALEFTTTDVNEMLSGLLGSLLLNSGSSTKMSTVLTSPLNSGSGAAVVLQCENDGGTDVPVITFGTITTPDDVTENFSPILTITPYAILGYGGQSGQTTVTHTSGSGNISIPADAISPGKGEAWGSSGGGGVSTNFGGSGAGGGEYACEPSFAIPPGGSVAYTAGAPGVGGIPGGRSSTPGNNSTLIGSSTTITAHGGQNGVSTDSPGNGGTGSANTVHFNGGNGGTTVGGKNGGGGGGSSGGTSGPGNNGAEGRTNGGAGGNAVTGGGPGGAGGNNGALGANGGTPGGGGGGGGAGAEAGDGATGKVRLTYSTGAPPILFSIASAAGTDQFGNNYPVGFAFTPNDGNLYNSGPAIARTTGTQGISSEIQAALTGLTFNVEPGEYKFRAMVYFKGNDTQAAYISMGGTCTASSFIATIDYNVVVSDVAQQTVLNNNSGLGSAALTNGGTYRAFVEGFITVSVAGTLTVNGATSADTLGWTSQNGSLLELIQMA